MQKQAPAESTTKAITPTTIPTTTPVLGPPVLWFAATPAAFCDPEVGVMKTVLTVPSAVTVWTAVGTPDGSEFWGSEVC
jgi:hypothetical protein